jgi:hypothetical protein
MIDYIQHMGDPRPDHLSVSSSTPNLPILSSPVLLIDPEERSWYTLESLEPLTRPESCPPLTSPSIDSTISDRSLQGLLDSSSDIEDITYVPETMDIVRISKSDSHHDISGPPGDLSPESQPVIESRYPMYPREHTGKHWHFNRRHYKSRSRRRRKVNRFSSAAIGTGDSKPLTVEFNRVARVDWTRLKPRRAGVIPYIRCDNNYKFCLGVDSQSGELTDFGGCVEYVRERSAVNGALREFHEETYDIFQKSIISNVHECRTVYSDGMMIMFMEIKVNIEDSLKDFIVAKDKCSDEEISSIVWLNMIEFYELFSFGETSINKQHYTGYKLLVNLLQSLYETEPDFVDRLPVEESYCTMKSNRTSP